MTIAIDKLSFADYCSYTDGSDRRYELVDGELIPMSLGTGQHGAIAEYLNEIFKTEIRQQNLPWTAKDMRIGVQSPRGGRWDTSRIPDVTVLTFAQWKSLSQREAIIPLNEAPPLLVVEVVSESTQTTDYRSKRSEYAILEIPEYWIVDPLQQRVTICTLFDRYYDEIIFTNGDRIISSILPELMLTAQQVLRAEN